MKIATIAAVNINNYGIGFEGKIPWKISEDLKRFRSLTTGGIVVMGRKTYDSIGRPLPNRENWVLSRDISGHRITTARLNGGNTDDRITTARLNGGNTDDKGVDWFIDAESLEFAIKNAVKDIFIIGGEQIYDLFLPLCTHQYITWVDGEYPADAFYPGEWLEMYPPLPAFDDQKWKICANQNNRETEDGIKFRFVDYVRI